MKILLSLIIAGIAAGASSNPEPSQAATSHPGWCFHADLAAGCTVHTKDGLKYCDCHENDDVIVIKMPPDGDSPGQPAPPPVTM